MNRRLITYNYLKTIANGSIHFYAFSYQYPGSSEYNQKLSERRAQAVYDVLTKTYGINASRLSIDAEGSSQQPYKTNDWNRIVIFVPGN